VVDVPKVECAVGVEFPAVVHIVPPGGVPVLPGEYIRAPGGLFRVVDTAGGGAGGKQEEEQDAKNRKMFFHKNSLKIF
jgi:hypothetical protein